MFLMLSRIATRRGWNRRDQREKCGQPVCGPAPEDPGVFSYSYYYLTDDCNTLHYTAVAVVWIKSLLCWRTKCDIFMYDLFVEHVPLQRETNGVVTMKVIPNLHGRSRACEVRPLLSPRWPVVRGRFVFRFADSNVWLRLNCHYLHENHNYDPAPMLQQWLTPRLASWRISNRIFWRSLPLNSLFFNRWIFCKSVRDAGEYRRLTFQSPTKWSQHFVLWLETQV